MDKAIRRVTDIQQQEAETHRYWQGRTIGERLIAVCELSEAAYAFAAAFKMPSAQDDSHDDQGSERALTSSQRKRG
jgi:hypothetical protein